MIGLQLFRCLVGPSLLFASTLASAATSSTTSLTILSGANVSLRDVVTISVVVTGDFAPIHPGTVLFCDLAVTHFCNSVTAIGTAQVKANGTATYKTSFNPGVHTLGAVFLGTRLATANTSGTDRQRR